MQICIVHFGTNHEKVIYNNSMGDKWREFLKRESALAAFIIPISSSSGPQSEKKLEELCKKRTLDAYSKKRLSLGKKCLF